MSKILKNILSVVMPRTADASKRFPGGFPSVITKQTAYQILNLNPNATKEEISQKHRKLLMKNHPDKGGSTYIALKINEAKEVLIKDDNDIENIK